MTSAASSHSSSRASHCLHTGHQSIGELNIGVGFLS